MCLILNGLSCLSLSRNLNLSCLCLNASVESEFELSVGPDFIIESVVAHSVVARETIDAIFVFPVSVLETIYAYIGLLCLSFPKFPVFAMGPRFIWSAVVIFRVAFVVVRLFCSAVVVFCFAVVVFCPALVVLCSAVVAFGFALVVFYPALVVFCFVCSVVEVSCSVCSTLVGFCSAVEVFCPVCSTLVSFCSAVGIFGPVCSAVEVLNSTSTAVSILVPCSASPALVSSSYTSTWTWPSIPPPVPPPPTWIIYCLEHLEAAPWAL